MASGTCPPYVTQCAQRSFASGRVNSLLCLLQRGLTPFVAFTISCASPKASPQLSLFARWAVLAAWTIRCWSWGPSRRYLTRTFSWMLGPLPRLSQWCLYPFLPTELRPSRNGYAVGSLAKTRTTTSVRTVISGLQSFLYVQASKFACHPGRSYRWHFRAQGSCDFYFRAPGESLPSRTSDMLAVRIGQLTAGDLHPIDSRPCRPHPTVKTVRRLIGCPSHLTEVRC